MQRRSDQVVMVRGSGDVGSAVAHRLFRAGYPVVIHDAPAPAAPRRGMAFTDAIFAGTALLEGVTARRVGLEHPIPNPDGPPEIAVVTDAFEAALAVIRPVVLVDARMRKRAVPEAQLGLAPLTVGLGPNFVAGETVDLVIETSWGDRLGTILTSGSPAPMAGEPRTYGGHARDRFIYAPAAGIFRTSSWIAQPVRAGQVVASLGGQDVLAPLDGILRGLTHDGAHVDLGAKCVEVDPRGDPALVVGIGERPGVIADGVVRALEEHLR